jgi:acetyl-CoA carboxylase biotin carboxyl carrier protein
MVERQAINDLVDLVDRLERLLERSGLAELEVEHEGTTVVLRTPAVVAPPVAAVVAAAAGEEAPAVPEPGPVFEEPAVSRGSHAVNAPLTGVFYRSPSPGAEAYVREGGEVSAGQVIGLIEAMKLFNEIKSDVTGVVRHIAAGDGDLVKARQVLIEVDPA